MIITYHGVDFFKIQQGDITIAVNPVSKDSKIKTSRFGSDIVLISTNDIDHNGVEAVSRGEKAPFIISGPGEYEVGGIFIKGFLSKTISNNINTIYMVNLENINLCFLGSLGEKELGVEAKKAVTDVDILFVPIGGENTIDPHSAEKIAVQFEPKIIIPSGFNNDSLKIFQKEMGEDNIKPIEKLTVKRKDIESMEGDVIVLEIS